MIVAERTTPRLSYHARQRCAEMGVTTKRAKRIVQDPDLVRPAQGALMAVSDADPDIAVVFTEETPPTIITVVWRTYETYDRETYRP